MTPKQRYHPAGLLFGLMQLIRNTFFIAIFLFVFKNGSSSPFIIYGRYALMLILILSALSGILKWTLSKYELDDRAFHLYSGIFNKTEQSIPYTKIQNVNRHTSFFHRILGLTSIRFETGMAGDDAAVNFQVISRKEASRLEAFVNDSQKAPSLPEAAEQEIKEHPLDLQTMERTVYFRPSHRDLVKASLTSFSFLLLFPILGSFYFKLEDYAGLGDEVAGQAGQLLGSWWLMAIAIFVLLLAAVLFGAIRTYIKYGKYEISADRERIYITKGVLEETAFSISKEKVQAIEINQSLFKQILGLAEVKLISAGSLSLGEEPLDISSLYPFLPEQRAHELISELLPEYEVTQDMERLPRKSFWIRMLAPNWLWIFITGGLYFVKPEVLGITSTWWIASLLLLLLVVTFRFLDYYHTRYTLNGRFIQLKTGGFSTSMFVTKREKIIEVAVTQNPVQKLLGLSSLKTVNRAKPTHHSKLADIPESLAGTFHQWYRARSNEVELAKPENP